MKPIRDKHDRDKDASADRKLGPNESLIGKPRSRERLATPAIVLDLDALEYNLAAMVDYCRKAKLSLRPHAKTHKSSTIAKLQVKSGANGICVATLREARALVEADVPHLLLTSPLVGATKIEAFVELIGRSSGLWVVVDNAEGVKALEACVKRSGKTLSVLVDVDIGMMRTGVTDVAGVLQLIAQLQSSDVLGFAGIQAYSGKVQHIATLAERARVYGAQLRHLEAVLESLAKAGIKPQVVSGGGTGTFEVDRRAGLFTESQAGSYIFMDIEYEEVELFERAANPFKTSLFLQSMVLSNNHAGSATIDAGFKSFSMDGPLPRLSKGTPHGAVFEFSGDEFGKITFAAKGEALELGAKVEFVTPHCDPTVNLHDFYHCVRGDVLVDIWPIDARGSL
jgi:D-serine deaminase-like pyridoxal phosphate-dependent protein